MNSLKLFCDNACKFLIMVVTISFFKECDSLCGNSFSSARALIFINGIEENYLANTCVKNLTIEKFQLLSTSDNTKIIIYPGTFVNLFHLHTIEMNNCGIKKVESRFLENTPNINIIKIEQNNLESIGRYTFDEIRLEELDVSTNSIRQIANGAFRNAIFEYLCLSNNKLTYIDPGWFQNTTITALSMTYNFVTILEENTFSGIKGVKSLMLSYNKIHSIHKKTFSSVQTLEIVYLPGNMLNTVNFEIKNNLKNIDVSFNRINYLLLDDNVLLWIMSIYPNPFECSCLRKFWKFTSKKQIQLWDTKSLKYRWKDEYPLCIAKYTVCHPETQIFDDVEADYFRKIDYNRLGRPIYVKEHDFIDLGTIN